MSQNYLYCISIPEELQQFTKVINILNEDNLLNSKKPDFGVKLIKDDNGNLTHTEYFSDSGELIKKIYYNGSSVSLIEHYRNNHIYSEENYNNGNITDKSIYNKQEVKICFISYKYNRDNQITCIHKSINNTHYSINYGYDELKRVNSRTIKINHKIINEQKYKYDILDRIVEYKDFNQCINVHKVNQNNELVSYTITDRIGNKIIINNKYLYSNYIGTDVELNGHKTSLTDKSYVYNLMLKKPYTSEDDLDFAMSNLIDFPNINSINESVTRRNTDNNQDITDYVINLKKETEYTKPIPAIKIKNLRFD